MKEEVMRTMLVKSFIASLLACLMGMPALAAPGYTSEAVPTKVDVVQSQGFMIFGAFGNPGATPCSVGNAIWVSKSHSDYTELFSVAMTAVAGRLKIYAYVHSCVTVGWYGGTYNQIIDGGAISLSN